jgi:hypothetical protein
VNWWEGGVFSEHVVPFDDLLTAWMRFVARVRADLPAALPELAEHKDYSRWFREGEAIIPKM